MAFIQSPIPEEQQNQFGGGGTTTANPLGTLPPQASGGSSGQGTSGGAAKAPGVGSPTQFGSAASRLSDYLSANANQTQGMAGDIAGKFNSQYGQQQGAIQGLGQQFGQDVNKGYTAYNSGLVDQATQNPDWFVKQNPDNVKAFQSQLNDQYTGPSNFESYQPYAGVQQGVNQALQQSELVKTYPGLSTYLQNNAQGNYTPGMNTLDTTLLQAYQPAYQTIKGAADQFGNLPGQLSDVAKGGNAAVQAAQAEAPKAAQYAQQGLTSAQDRINKAIQDQLTSAQGAYGTYNKDVGQLRGAAQDINSAVQDYLRQNSNISISGNNDFLAPWVNLQEMTTTPTLENVSRPEDFANILALQQLAGNPGAINTPLDLSKASMAGTFGLPQDLEAAINNQAVPEAMRNELGSISSQITGAYKPYQDLVSKEETRAGLRTQYDNITSQLNSLKNDGTPETAAKRADLQQQQQAIMNKANEAGVGDRLFGSYADDIRNTAQGIQWLPQAATGYNDLIARLQADMQGLGGMGVPTYSPMAASATPDKAANMTGVGVGAGTAAGAGLSAVGAGTGMAAADVAAQTGMSLAEAQAAIDAAATTGGNVGFGTLSALSNAVPAAAAAYGASNIAQNAAANPIKSGIGTLANTGMSLATLSLPPKILDSIGTGLKNVLSNIGNFFKHLF